MPRTPRALNQHKAASYTNDGLSSISYKARSVRLKQDKIGLPHTRQSPSASHKTRCVRFKQDRPWGVSVSYTTTSVRLIQEEVRHKPTSPGPFPPPHNAVEIELQPCYSEAQSCKIREPTRASTPHRHSENSTQRVHLTNEQALTDLPEHGQQQSLPAGLNDHALRGVCLGTPRDPTDRAQLQHDTVR